MGECFNPATPILDFNGFNDVYFNPRKNENVGQGADPDLFMFWDKVHPTAKIHQLIGEKAYALVWVPEPASIWLVITLSAACRRRPA